MSLSKNVSKFIFAMKNIFLISFEYPILIKLTMKVYITSYERSFNKWNHNLTSEGSKKKHFVKILCWVQSRKIENNDFKQISTKQRKRVLTLHVIA